MPGEVYNCPCKDRQDPFGILLWFTVGFCTLRFLSVVHSRLRVPRGYSSLSILPPLEPRAPWPCLVGHVTKFFLILAGHFQKHSGVLSSLLWLGSSWESSWPDSSLPCSSFTSLSPLRTSTVLFPAVESWKLKETQGKRGQHPEHFSAVCFILRFIIGN